MTPSIVCAIDASPHARTTVGIASGLAERLSVRLIGVDALTARNTVHRLCAVARDEEARFIVVGSRATGRCALRS